MLFLLSHSMPQNQLLQVAFGASSSVGILSSRASYRKEEPHQLPSHWNSLKGSCGSYQIAQKDWTVPQTTLWESPFGYVLLFHFVQATLPAQIDYCIYIDGSIIIVFGIGIGIGVGTGTGFLLYSPHLNMIMDAKCDKNCWMINIGIQSRRPIFRWVIALGRDWKPGQPWHLNLTHALKL